MAIQTQPQDVSSDLHQLVVQYRAIMAALVAGRDVVEVPWHDYRFRQLFHQEMSRFRDAMEDAKKWDVIKDLCRTIGSASR